MQIPNVNSALSQQAVRAEEENSSHLLLCLSWVEPFSLQPVRNMRPVLC